MPFDPGVFHTHAEKLPPAVGCMNLLEPRIAPEFEECWVTSAERHGGVPARRIAGLSGFFFEASRATMVESDPSSCHIP